MKLSWTEEEIEKLKYLASKGKTHKEISEVLERSKASVSSKMSYLKIRSNIWWNGDKDIMLKNLINEGKDIRSIADTLQVTVDAVYQRKGTLNIISEKHKHRYQVGETVNETLKIVKQTRSVKQNRKAYEVQSLVYPDAPTYTVLESSLNRGTGCGYSISNRIYEGNSLYSIEDVRPYLIDIEEAKTISPNSTKKIKVKCLNCHSTKSITPNNLLTYGVRCTMCATGISYPEKFFMSYLEVKGVTYEYQKNFESLPNKRFDFYLPRLNIVVETHGEQHYKNKSGSWDTTKTQKSDKIKEQYCIDNDIGYISIDCSKSDFKYIRNNIAEVEKLPSIEDREVTEITNDMSYRSVYPVTQIIREYRREVIPKDIGEMFGISDSIVRAILRKYNIVVRTAGQSKSRKVRNIKTNKVYESLKQASKLTNDNVSKIQAHCSGKRSNQNTLWEYVEEEEENGFIL